MDKLDKTTFKATPKDDPKDRIEVEVGDSKQPDFKPQVKIMRWDNEINFSLRAEEEANATVEEKDGTIKYITAKQEVHMYDKPEAGEDGGFEFEWILKELPISNVLTATIQSKDLDFFFQPPLTPEAISEGVVRPDNVVGSYAVYHKSKRDSRVGGKSYKTGKAFHIYRPKVTDAAGDEVWAELAINEQAGVLSVTVPQEFLNSALYPVIVDPTIGYTSIGATDSSSWSGYVVTSPESQADASGGTLSKIQAAVHDAGGDSNIKLALYSSSGAPGSLVSGSSSGALLVTQTTKPTQDSEWTSSSSISGTIVADSFYRVAFNKENNTVISSLDTGGASGDQYHQTQAYADFPTDPFPSSPSSGNNRFSVYATYTASAPEPTLSLEKSPNTSSTGMVRGVRIV